MCATRKNTKRNNIFKFGVLSLKFFIWNRFLKLEAIK